MTRTLKQEIKQMQPFASSAEEAMLNLERTTDHLRREVHLVLRQYGLTSTQYNALRILRARVPGGLTCTDLGNRLVSADPDITRLLDRLARQKMVRRRRDLRDRRVVLTEITPEGLDVLSSVTPLLDDRVRALFEHMTAERVELFIDLLEEARRSPHQQPVPQDPKTQDPETPSTAQERRVG